MVSLHSEHPTVTRPFIRVKYHLVHSSAEDRGCSLKLSGASRTTRSADAGFSLRVFLFSTCTIALAPHHRNKLTNFVPPDRESAHTCSSLPGSCPCHSHA